MVKGAKQQQSAAAESSKGAKHYLGFLAGYSRRLEDVRADPNWLLLVKGSKQQETGAAV